MKITCIVTVWNKSQPRAVLYSLIISSYKLGLSSNATALAVEHEHEQFH